MTSILALGICELADRLRNKDLSAVEVTDAFLLRQHALQKDIRPMAMVCDSSARAAAKASDKRRKDGELFSDFDGVPLTLKECFDVKGLPSTIGISSRKSHVAKEDAVVTRLLAQAGTVLLGKTNLSQLMLFNESRNPVYGQTNNPFSLDRTPGGSSGGEAAAIAAYGSPGGMGTDIGGSIRVPAAYTGIYGIKPTVDRISNRGITGAIPGQEVIRGTCGPMARSVQDLRALFSILSPAKCAALDPRVSPLPIGDGEKRLRVGFYVDDGFLRPSRAIERGLLRARTILEDAGVEVIDFSPILQRELVFLYLSGISADGAETILARVPRNELDPALSLLAMMARVPKKAKSVAAKLIGYKDPDLGALLSSVGKKDVRRLWRITADARKMQAQIFDSWQSAGIDAVLCAPHATPALPHGASRDFTLGGALAMRFNLLNFPAGVAPITKVAIDEPQTLGRTGELGKRANRIDHGSAGLPIGVQVVARPFREDIVLQLMEILEEGTKDDCDLPRLPVPA